MTAAISCYGRLGGDPRSIPTKTGNAMAVATLAVDIAEDAEGPPQWFGVVAFGQVAETLLRHAKGDLLSISGRLQRRTYTDRNGEEREQLQVIADTIISARSVRPGGGRKRMAGKPRGEMLGELVP